MFWNFSFLAILVCGQMGKYIRRVTLFALSNTIQEAITIVPYPEPSITVHIANFLLPIVWAEQNHPIKNSSRELTTHARCRYVEPHASVSY